MILGAGAFQVHLIEQAQAMGACVVVVSPEGDYPGLKIADRICYHDATDEEGVLGLAKQEQVDGIISDQGEIFVKPIAYVAEKLGLPGNPYEVACRYTNKYKMRERSLELGLPTIRARQVETLDEAMEFFREIGGNAIIKPVDGFSSKGVSRIPSEEELTAKFDEAKGYSRSGKVIIEHFVTGPQFEVDSLAVNGHVKPLMYADLDEFDIPNVFSSRTRLYPSIADDDTIRRLLEYNRKINEGFGLVNGMTHNEYIMDEKTGEIYLIEAALRGGGTYIASHIAKLETGIDTAEFLVNMALGRIDDVPEYEMNQCHAGYTCCYLPAGEVVGVDGIEEVEALEYVVKTTLDRVKIGNKCDNIADKDQRQAIVLYADSRDEMMKRIAHIRDLLKIEVRTENGTEGPIWE